jgi:outer membrane protein assembly factor BamB
VTFAICRAEDWPQFRGPHRDAVSHEAGLISQFPAEGLKVRWRHPVGSGLSTPAIAGGRVFVTDAIASHPAKERLQCFAEKSGESLWDFSYELHYPDWAYDEEHNGGPTATPVGERDRLYFCGSSGAIFCLNATTGAEIWSRHLEKEFTVPELTCRSSPLIEGDLLIVIPWGKPGANVVALDKQTGRVVWKAIDETVSNSSPIVITAAHRRQLIFWTSTSITSLDPLTGAPLWREPLTTSGNDSIPTPVCHGNRLLISGLMLELNADAPGAHILWPDSKAPLKRLLSQTSSPAWQGDYIYSAKSSGAFVCLDAATGRQLWSVNDVTTLTQGASINITECAGVSYLFTDAGDLISAHLSSGGCEQISRTHLLDPTMPFFGRPRAWTPPAIANGCVYARNAKEIVCASLTAGE